MKLRITSVFTAIFLAISILALKSCNERDQTVSCFPNAPINVTLNLNLPAYYPLQSTGGWIYVDQQNAGTRGLIVVNTGSGFKAYDRNAPHLCPANDTTLQVKDDIKIVCPKDGGEWILLTGQPTKTAAVPPKTYLCSFSNNILYISN